MNLDKHFQVVVLLLVVCSAVPASAEEWVTTFVSKRQQEIRVDLDSVKERSERDSYSAVDEYNRDEELQGTVYSVRFLEQIGGEGASQVTERNVYCGGTEQMLSQEVGETVFHPKDGGSPETLPVSDDGSKLEFFRVDGSDYRKSVETVCKRVADMKGKQ
jgi:hypothetical protein